MIRTNLADIRRAFRLGSSQVRGRLRSELERAGRMTEAGAVRDVPVDTGKLRQSINYERTNGGYGARVMANEPYAAYVEFGTGVSVLIPSGWEEVAASFRGSGGRTFSMPPRPYLIPNYYRQAAELESRLRTYVASLNR